MRSSFPVHIEAAQLRGEVGLLVDFAELGAPLYLRKPLRIHTTHQADAVVDVLRLAEEESLAGHWVAGFLSFEAAAAFSLPVHSAVTLPLAWFAVFSQVDVAVFPALSPPVLQTLSAEIGWERYQRDIQTILAHIGAGNSYQVNYTLQTHLDDCDPAELFLALQTAHRHPYAAWLHCDYGSVACFSPELFLRRQENRLLTAPIKGTCARWADPQVDAEQGWLLEQSVKDRAEHVMIVDMARNDLGKVCQIGSISVDHLFERRVFPTVQHLETWVQGVQMPGLGLAQIMAALFPAASITGAPKRRTMEIIQALEGQPRGFYTGSIGVIRPGGDFIFNVLIRTVTWLGKKRGCIGLGGGIVADSDSSREWAEIADKGRFLREVPAPFQLIETFLLDQHGQSANIDRHLLRLQASARCLGFFCDLKEIEASVRQKAALWHKEGLAAQVVRLLLELSGAFSIQHRPCPIFANKLKVRMAPYCVDRLDRLLRHKTTRRQQFDQALAVVRAAGDEDALFVNNLGYITEGAIRAILVRFGQQWYAPPLADGLLASIWRAMAMERLSAQEKSLSLEDLLGADEIRMGNSVQGGAQVVRLTDAAGKSLAEWGW